MLINDIKLKSIMMKEKARKTEAMYMLVHKHVVATTNFVSF